MKSAIWALSVIFLANFFNYLDRQLVSALEKPIETALSLSETEFGILWTLFTIGYMVCAVPIGAIADRYSRPKLFSFCIVVWSVATIASGLAQDKWVLYISRIFIGVGEAGCLVIGPAMISDLFDPSRRSRALSMFYLAMPLGGTAAFILAGVFIKVIDWRVMFFLAGAPGFLIAVLIWYLRDPPRGESEGAHHGMHGGGSFADYVQLLKTRTLLFIILAQAAAVIILIPLIHFGIKFFEDARGLGETGARISLGVMALVGGGLGSVASGIIGDRLFQRTKAAYALLAGVCYLLGWPCLLIGFLVPSPWVFLPMLTLGSFFLFLCMPAVNTQIANVVSPAQRATAWALAVFILHLLGDTLAPPIFGKISETYGRQEAFLIFSVGLLLAGGASLLAATTAKADMERVARLVEEQKEEVSAQPQVVGEPGA